MLVGAAREGEETSQVAGVWGNTPALGLGRVCVLWGARGACLPAQPPSRSLSLGGSAEDSGCQGVSQPSPAALPDVGPHQAM